MRWARAGFVMTVKPLVLPQRASCPAAIDVHSGSLSHGHPALPQQCRCRADPTFVFHSPSSMEAVLHVSRTVMNSPTSNTLDAVTGTTTALMGFLRGIERRAAIFAELQCGEAAHGDQTLAPIFNAFVAIARAAPQVEWLRLFWTNFLESPALATEPLAPFWEGDFAPLARLDFAARAVVLARLVAELDDQQASLIFGVSQESYRQALQRALPQRADGKPDGEAWLALRSEARYVLEELSPERSAAVARMREAVVLESEHPQQAEPQREPSLLNRTLPLSIPINLPLRAPAWLSKLRGGGHGGA